MHTRGLYLACFLPPQDQRCTDYPLGPLENFSLALVHLGSAVTRYRPIAVPTASLNSVGGFVESKFSKQPTQAPLPALEFIMVRGGNWWPSHN